MENIQFKSAEHYIQYKKALLFGDSITANQILKADTALDAKLARTMQWRHKREV